MRWIKGLCGALSILFCVTLVRADDTTAPKRGVFEMTFTERSPLTSPKEFYKRLNAKPPASDYKLDEAPFLLYVPEDYDASVPHGVLVYAGYKDSGDCPADWKPVFDKTHTIYVVCKKHDDDPAVQACKLIDALANIKKLYTIDEQRLYCAGFDKNAIMLGVFCGDIFNKPIHIDPDYWRNVPLSGNQFLPASMPKPTGAPFAAAKLHRHVIVHHLADRGAAIQKAYSQDGLTNTYIQVDIEDIHFPHMAAAWLEKAFAYLDAGPVNKSVAKTAAPAAPASAPSAPVVSAPVATAPVAAANDPARMLSLAKSYISANRTDLARTRLKAIIDQYPNDPAAKEAKTLLDQLKDQK